MSVGEIGGGAATGCTVAHCNDVDASMSELLRLILSDTRFDNQQYVRL